MSTTPYAWARSFSIVFILACVDTNGEMKWATHHDIACWIVIHENKGTPIVWLKLLMLRSDGIHYRRPIFSLLLHNHKVVASLQRHDRYVQNTSSFETSTTLEAIRNIASNDAMRIQVDFII